MTRYSLKSFIGQAVIAGLILFLFPVGGLRAQAPPPNLAPTQGAPQQLLSPDQLDDLVAPIALYPDQLLSQVLVACTYPLEVVEAQQWLQQNNSLKGTQLMDAARQQNWDASVQALVAFPDVLGRLNQDVRWTTDLGNAFLAQQADVMTAVQRMRARAQANGRLSSSAQQTVTAETQGGQSAIEIQPANPDVMYVPYYDPMYVWGPPAWGYYPSLYYPAFGFGFWPGINIGFCFGGWGGWGFGGWGWGWGPSWFGHSVFVNNGFFGRYGFRGGYGGGFRGGFGGAGFAGRTMWAHDASHRLGVAYPNRQLAGRFQAASAASRANLSSRSFAGNRSMAPTSRQGASTYGARSFQGNQTNRGTGAGSFQGSRYQQSPRSSSGMSRSYSGGAARSYSGGAARSYSGGAARSYSGGGARSYSGGGAARSYSGGGARSFSGGGARSFGGGGGGHSFGGGGGHGGRR